jgi:hypothetical protein
MLKFFDWVYHNGTALAESLELRGRAVNVVQLVEGTWSDI